MEEVPTDQILESLYKLRIRDSEQLKNVSAFVRSGHGAAGNPSELLKTQNYGRDRNKVYAMRSKKKACQIAADNRMSMRAMRGAQHKKETQGHVPWMCRHLPLWNQLR